MLTAPDLMSITASFSEAAAFPGGSRGTSQLLGGFAACRLTCRMPEGLPSGADEMWQLSPTLAGIRGLSFRGIVADRSRTSRFVGLTRPSSPGSLAQE